MADAGLKTSSCLILKSILLTNAFSIPAAYFLQLKKYTIVIEITLKIYLLLSWTHEMTILSFPPNQM